MLHVDDWLDDPANKSHIAHEFLEHARRPAVEKDHAWLSSHHLLVDWQGKSYWCVGASRLGDVWLKERDGGKENAFYDHRVDMAELSNWRSPLSEE